MQLKIPATLCISELMLVPVQSYWLWPFLWSSVFASKSASYASLAPSSRISTPVPTITVHMKEKWLDINSQKIDHWMDRLKDNKGELDPFLGFSLLRS